MEKQAPEDLRFPNVRLLEESGGSAPRVTDFLPHAFPPLHSIPIDVVDLRTLAALASATFLVVDSRANDSVLRFWANEVTAAAGYADIRWTILVNGLALAPYNDMALSRGAINNPDPVMIPIEKGQKVEVYIVNNSAVSAWEVRTRVKGWIY